MRLLIVDANNLFCRAWFAAPMGQKETKTEQYFKRAIVAAKRDLRVDSVVICWDGGRDPERLALFPEYKAGRAEKPAQFFALMQAIEGMILTTGLYENVRQENVEADDAIATIANYYDCPDHTVFIFTNDKDFMQLTGKNIVIHHPQKGNIDGILFKKEFGFESGLYADYLALVGDAVDNIPGAQGIGEQGAKFLIQKYGNIDSIYANIDQIDKRYQWKLLNSREMVSISKKLTLLKKDIAINMPWMVF